MGIGSDIGSTVSGIAGLFSDDGSGAAFDYYKNLADKYGKLNPTITAQTYGADSPTRQAQLSALDELKDMYSSGGLDAVGRSQIAEANTEANRNANANYNAVLERARANGNTNSGVTSALQMEAGQDAAQRSANAGYEAAAAAERNRLGALGQAGQLSTAAGTQQNAIDRYNAMAKQGAQESTYQNQLSQLGGEGAAYGAGYSAKNTGYRNNVNAWNTIGKGAGGALDDYLKG